MKNPELFHKTVGILVNAYMNDTLRHFNCCACAVGNIVAANCGIKYMKAENDDRKKYGIVYDYFSGKYDPRIESWFEILMDKHSLSETCLSQIESTGYSIKEILKIEKAFEKANPSQHPEVDTTGYLGLMSVLDTLMIIHEANEEEITEAKALFLKA